MAYKISLEGNNKILAENLLIEITSLLDKNNIIYCLEGGTLLGIYRENRLLPWDNDLDLSILEDELIKIDKFIEDLRKANFRVRTRYFQKDDFYFKKRNLRIIKIRNKSLFGLIKGPICLEIFIKYKRENCVYWKVGNKTMAAPLFFYEKIRTILFLNKEYKIPLETEAYLEHKYGNWKIQQKEWNTMENEGSIIKD